MRSPVADVKLPQSVGWSGNSRGCTRLCYVAPQIPWPKIIGMRNVLVHGYFDIDTDIVWQAVASDVPVLKAAVLSLLGRVESQVGGS